MEREKFKNMTDDEFDSRLRLLAQRETAPPPPGFEARIQARLQSLPEQTRRPSRRIRRLLTAAAAVAVIGTITAAAAPTLFPMARNAVSYFAAPSEFRYLSQQAAFERFSAAVGASTEDQGIKLTLDDIAVSDNYINVFYTVQSDAPIVLRGDDGTPESWRAAWTAPAFWFKADGTYIDPAAQIETEGRLEDAYTLKGMQRFAVMNALPDTFQLELYTSEMLDKTGDWHIAVGIDKSAVAAETLTVEPDRKMTVNAGGTSHRFTVSRVSVSPFGGQLVLRERTGSVPFCSFVLRDDQGNYLPVLNDSLQSNFLFAISNSFEFLGGSTDMKSLTLVPYETAPPKDERTGDVDTSGDSAAGSRIIPVQEAVGALMETTNLGGVHIDSLDIRDGVVTVVGTPYGAADLTFQFELTDKNGEALGCPSYAEYHYDRTKGTVTCVIRLDAEAGELERIQQRIGGLSYYCQEIRLLEDQAATIEMK